ncbi:amino acid adenylation domain-containing protein [Xanthomonas euroxanthea]|uniref:Amino acid adenylation domain-containing protein n=1 Tax=Xanthomonas euroxanthea TaxID=2259622 RepID=A0A8E4GEN9_9XANT|nr:non-ribosomal peptide synthetase [Xanthomonas euroxanthea]CAD1792142.1 amino acid adenylation domain-containing protein [Xanthomonas euroxanthea]SYZ56256.1 non-ribosomal peptide synthetase [Xanthomonas arboricola pv. juglandis]
MDTAGLGVTATLLDVLCHRAADASCTRDKVAFTFLGSDGETPRSLTFFQLDRAARGLAVHIRAHAVPGDRVMLVYPPGLDYIIAFFACVYAGVVSVPALPPTHARSVPRLQAMMDDCAPRLALAPDATLRQLDGMHGVSIQSGGMTWLATDRLPCPDAEWERPALTAKDLVFLQYTSGSTGTPKGVMVSHRNSLANVHLAASVYDITESDSFMTWLPPHHDFGLIGGIIFPVVVGCSSVQFAPAAFLRRPGRWLQTMSEYRATVTGGPNFAYALCNDRVPDALIPSLDLSCVRVMVNGAERIRYDTLSRFASRFAACGLRAGVLTPSYGLAESTLLVSASAPRERGVSQLVTARRFEQDPVALETGNGGRDAVGALELPSVGCVNAGQHRVVVVDPSSGCEVRSGEIGEIWVTGPSVACGYWNQAAQSQAVFHAQLPGDNALYLRTGDLGFVVGEQLYVAGRIKELMVFNGRNIHPQDVEAIIEGTSDDFRADACVAFSEGEGHAAELIVVQEVESHRQLQPELLATAIRTALAEQLELYTPTTVILVKAGTLPRTTSGKLQRVHCRELHRSGTLPSIWSSAQTTRLDADGALERSGTVALSSKPFVQRLGETWMSVLGLEQVDEDSNFWDAGGHSVLAMQLLTLVETEFGCALTVRDLFEHPTVGQLAGRLQQLRPTEVGCETAGAITHVERAASYPLASAQQRLWFLDRLDAAAGVAYNIPSALRLRGRLDVTALQAALDCIVARHDSLRTRFVASAEGATQQVAAEGMGLSLARHDLGRLQPYEQSSEVERLRAEEAVRPFDLSVAPLIRGALLHLSPREHVLLLTQHHVISDGWSIGVLTRELRELYTAFCQGQADPLPPLQVQYVDAAAWQERRLRGSTLDTQLSYWRKHLLNAPPLLELPLDRPRPAVQSYAGGSMMFTLPDALVNRLQTLSRSHGTTLFMTMLSAWTILLSRLSTQEEVVIGTPVANRPHPGMAGLIGLFVNTLALRVRVPAGLTIAALLEQVRDTALSAYAHQDVPFEQVVEAVRPARSLGYNPVFQTLLMLDASPEQRELTLPGLEVEPLPATQGTTLVDLSLWLTLRGNALSGRLEYATALFDAATIERWVGHLQTLLWGMVDTPSLAVDRLPLHLREERMRLVRQFNPAEREVAIEPTLAEVFEAQVQRTPDAIALCAGEERISYSELNRRANRVARQLLALGVCADDRVGLHVERGSALVVGALAILKAGGAYVPLDPSYPAERLAHMLADSAPKALLTTGTGPLAWAAGVERLRADEGAQSEAWPLHDPVLERGALQPAQLAYVIYTSGSTGVPKGVMVEHRNAVNFVAWARSVFHADQLAQTLFSTSMNFDLALFEVFVPLSVGACVRIVPDLISHVSTSAGCSLVNSVPSVMDAALDVGELPASVGTVNLAGEPLKRGLAEKLFGLTGIEQLFNLYGPTETTTYSTWVRMDRSTGFVPHLGQPVFNTQVHVLDAHGEPTPLGVCGEIHIGGAGVARGYLNRPDLTAERFVADPFRADPLARLYRTGDIGRRMPDGSLEYVGRSDFQVKVRGFRVELGEIEARLATCEGVREAVVLMSEDHQGDKVLVAYVLAQAGTAAQPAALRAALAQTLPAYMVPAAFVPVTAWPLTPNGKLDRKALGDMSAAAVPTCRDEPHGETELAVAALWREVFGLESIGREDDFFDLGGHSMTAVKLASRMSQAFSLEIPMVTLFQHRTIASMSKAVLGARLAAFSTSDVARLSAQLDALSDDDLKQLLMSDDSSAELTLLAGPLPELGIQTRE